MKRDSLRPGQLDRLTAGIKDFNPTDLPEWAGDDMEGLNKAQAWLIEHGYGDLIINFRVGLDHRKWVYVSDVMMKFSADAESVTKPKE